MLFPSLSRSCASRRVLLASSRRLHASASAVVELDYSKNVPPSGNETDKPLVILHGLLCVHYIYRGVQLTLLQRIEAELDVALEGVCA